MTILTSPFGQRGWYPESATLLRDMITQSSHQSSPSLPISAVICPHAGYGYCGDIIGKIMHQTANQHIDHIIIIGPSHYVALHNNIIAPSATEFHSELGSSLVNHNFLSNISAPISYDDTVHANEHSIWMMMPFIHHYHPTATVSPFIVGNLNRETIRSFAKSLTQLITRATLIVISSDFTHYGKSFQYRPFTDNIPEKIKAIDQTAIDFICAHDVNGFWDWYHANPTTICGRYAISILLDLMDTSNVIDQCYIRSGDISNDWNHSVSYAGLAFGTKELL